MTNLKGSEQSLLILIDILQSSGFDVEARIEQMDRRESAGSSEEEPTRRPEIVVHMSGPDTPLLTARNGKLLLAIEEVAAQLLDLQPDEMDRISFDADNFKADRERNMRSAAETAIGEVQATSEPYTFPPMSSRERRMLHLALAKSGLASVSTGDIPRRSVVLYPAGMIPPADQGQSPFRNERR